MLHYQKLFQRMVEGVLVIKKGREKSAATAVYNLIENKNINNTIIAVLIFYVTKKIIKKNNIK